MRPLRFFAFAAVAGASAALASLAACVGDDPTPVGAAVTEDAAPTPTPGQDSSTADTAPPVGTDAGKDSGPKHFCDTQAPLTGVTDFFCADFDGPKGSENFTKSNIPDGGTITQVTDAFFSPPNSLTTTKGATLVWEKVGATPFLEVEANVRIHATALGGVVAPANGYVVILKLSSVDTNVELRYTDGAMVEGAVYKGYYLNATFCPSACGLVEKKLSNTLPVNVWTDVQIIWQKTGTIKVNFNTLPVLSPDLSGVTTTSTKVSATIGVVGIGQPIGVGRHAYDNLVVSVKR
jgi:hypothetical protein